MNPLHETFWVSTNPLAIVLMTVLLAAVGAPALGYLIAVWMGARRDTPDPTYDDDDDSW